MATRRKFTGRSDILQTLLGGLIARYGSEIGVNPEFEDAAAAQAYVDANLQGPVDPTTLNSGALNEPFKAKGFWAKGNAAAMNADYLGNRIDAKGRSSDRKQEMQFGHGLDLEKLIKDFELRKQQEQFAQELQTTEGAKRSDVGVAAKYGLTSKNVDRYNVTTADDALAAAKSGFRKDSATAEEIATKARIGNQIAKDTAGDTFNTAIDEANIKRQLAGGALNRVGQVIENQDYDAGKYQRNAELNYINARTSPVAPGTSIFDIATQTPIYTAPSQDMLIPGMPGYQEPNVAAKAQAGGKVVVLDNGRRVIGKTGDTSAMMQQVPAKPQLPEPSTATTLQPPPAPSVKEDDGMWILENGRYVFKKKPPVLPIPDLFRTKPNWNNYLTR